MYVARTGFISPLYDNSFSYCNGGEKYNDTVADHIWSNLLNENDTVENLVDDVGDNQQLFPLLHPSWLPEEDGAHREQQIINTQISRRMNLEQQNTQSDCTHTEEDIPGVTQTASNENYKSEEEDPNEYSINMLRRGPSQEE